MKTVLCYHDKKKEHYGTISGKLPIFDTEEYEPFLLTTKEVVTVQTNDIASRVHAFPIRHAIKSVKTDIATILLVPGIITAILYILDFGTALIKARAIPQVIPSWITNLTFWLAVWGAMILWNETYRTIHLKKRLAPSDSFSEHDVKIIKQGDLGLSKKTLLNPIHVIEPDVEHILLGSCTIKSCPSSTVFQKLLAHPHATTVLDRLNLLGEQKELEKLASAQNLPAYPLSAVRSLLVYSAEEAILSGNETIAVEHLFIAFFKIFPALQSFLKKRKLNLELMRYIASWISLKEDARQATRIFDPENQYLRTGGIAQSWIYGYTFILGHYSKDLTQELARSGGHYGIGHEPEMEEVLANLNKISNRNVLLIGESGTGKTSIAKGIAERINRKRVPEGRDRGSGGAPFRVRPAI